MIVLSFSAVGVGYWVMRNLSDGWVGCGDWIVMEHVSTGSQFYIVRLVDRSNTPAMHIHRHVYASDIRSRGYIIILSLSS